MHDCATDVARAAQMLAGQADLPCPDGAVVADARRLATLGVGCYVAQLRQLETLTVVARGLESIAHHGRACAAD